MKKGSNKVKKKIAKVSAASLITLSMTVGNVTAINGINDTNEAETNENEEIERHTRIYTGPAVHRGAISGCSGGRCGGYLC